MNEIEKFVNTRYRVLRYLIENKDRLNIVRCTQEEMGASLSLSRGTINRVLNELKSNGYIEDNNHYWEYKLTNKAIDIANVLNFQKNASNIDLNEIKKIYRELESIRDYALAGRSPKWCDENGNPTEYYDYEMSNAAINDIYEVTHSLKVIINKMEGNHEN